MVIIVDDELFNIFALQALLKSFHLQADSAQSGMEVVKNVIIVAEQVRAQGQTSMQAMQEAVHAHISRCEHAYDGRVRNGQALALACSRA
jgi:hypothetical protein